MSGCSQTNAPTIQIVEDVCKGNHIASSCIYHTPSIFFLNLVANTNLQSIITAIANSLQQQANNIQILNTRVNIIEDKLHENLQKVITASYTLTADDFDYTIFINNGATNITISVPADLPESFNAKFIQQGTGDVTFVYNASVITVRTPVGFKIKGQHYCAFLEKVLNTTIFQLFGDTKI